MIQNSNQAKARMFRTSTQWAPLPLRIMLGAGFFHHGWPKLFSSEGHQGFVGMLGSLGVPAPGITAWLVALAEIVGGLALLLGWQTRFAALMLFLYLIAVVVLAEKFAIPLDNCIERFGMPQAFGGAIVAGLVLAPEALSGIKAAMRNQLQRSVNILHGSVLASIGLTIPAVLVIGMLTKRPVTLGIEGGNFPLLLLTLAVSIVTFGSGRTSVLQGCIHLLLFGVFLLLIFCP